MVACQDTTATQGRAKSEHRHLCLPAPTHTASPPPATFAMSAPAACVPAPCCSCLLLAAPDHPGGPGGALHLQAPAVRTAQRHSTVLGGGTHLWAAAGTLHHPVCPGQWVQGVGRPGRLAGYVAPRAAGRAVHVLAGVTQSQRQVRSAVRARTDMCRPHGLGMKGVKRGRAAADPPPKPCWLPYAPFDTPFDLGL